MHMILPVCRSPCSNAAPSHANFFFNSPIAAFISASARSAAAAASSCGEVHLLFSASAYGSVKMTCSVSAHMSSFCPNAARFLRKVSHPTANALDPKSVVARYSPM